MKHVFLPLKISPVDVLPLLLIIEKNENDREKIELVTIDYYKKSSKNIQSPHLSPFRVRVAHSFRKLHLLEGENLNISLSAEGKYLCTLSKDLNKFKRELARIILQLDIEKCNIIEIFKNSKASLSYKDLVNKLKKNEIVVKKTDDKLRRWLQFLTYCDIVSFNSSVYTLNSNVVEALLAPKKTILVKEFKKVLYDEYEELKKSRGAYVSIPLIKSAVTNRLKNKGFSPFDFKYLLMKLISESSGKRILLSQTGVQQVGGIMENNIYYHFLAIDEK